MHFREIDGLFHLTAIENLPGIMRRGLLSHSAVRRERLCRSDISDGDVQSIRARKRAVDGRCLHDYVPLYFNPRNAMMYRCVQEHGAGALALLMCEAKALFWGESLASDRNAARGDAVIGCARAILPDLSRERVFRRRWDSDDEQAEMQAEVLISGRLAPTHIHQIVVSSNGAKARVHEVLGHDLAKPVLVKPDPFFCS